MSFFGARTGAPTNLVPRKTDIRLDYEISNTALGTGVSGKVYTCYDRVSGHKHALKILKDNPAGRNEVDIQWRMSVHPYVVPIRAVYENNYKHVPHLFVIMDCMEGGELLDRIQAKGSFVESEAAHVFRCVCSAVLYMHQMDMAHRDLKPENILYVDQTEQAEVKLTDFGFAKLQSLGLKTPCFTPYYVAPEVLQNEKKDKAYAIIYGKACDVWSLGVILYILLCGYPPFYTEHGGNISPGMKRRIRLGEFNFPPEEWGSITGSVKDLIMSMLKVNASERVTIEEIVKHPWVSGEVQVPHTPLATSARLEVDKFDMKVAVLKQVADMRGAEKANGGAQDVMHVPADKQMKPLAMLNSSLLERRRKH